jgi:hypothetical protein
MNFLMLDFTPLFRFYARSRRAALAREDAAAMQAAQLKRLINRSHNTRFGREHGFSRLRSVADFQRAVPLRRYEEMWSQYWQPSFPHLKDTSWPGTIRLFAATSGTSSGTSKYIPVSAAMTRANLRAAFDVLVHHLVHRPQSHVLGGRMFLLGGSTDFKNLAPGIFSGDLSGIALKRVPWSLRPYVFPPSAIAAELDWDRKIEDIVRAAPSADIRMISGTPPWLLRLFEKQGDSAQAVYPHLELLVHGGVNFDPYRASFEQFLGDGVELREAYAASEGFIAIQDEAPEAGLRLVTDNGLFFEFVPLHELDKPAPARRTLADAEMGVDYALALSSCAGLWAYLIGDTVRLVSRNPPRILITGRTSYFMSAFGEHLTGGEIERAVSIASGTIGAAITDFAMGAMIPRAPGEIARHCYVVEFSARPMPESMEVFGKTVDTILSRSNDDYAHYRSDGRIASPLIVAVRPGTFAAWMKARGRLGGQNKVPRIINDNAIFSSLLDFVATLPIGQ